MRQWRLSASCGIASGACSTSSDAMPGDSSGQRTTRSEANRSAASRTNERIHSDAEQHTQPRDRHRCCHTHAWVSFRLLACCLRDLQPPTARTEAAPPSLCRTALSQPRSHRTHRSALAPHRTHIHIMALEVRLRAHGFCAREPLGPMVISALSSSSLRSLRLSSAPSFSQPTDANLQALANVLRTTLGDDDKARKAGTNEHQHSVTEPWRVRRGGRRFGARWWIAELLLTMSLLPHDSVSMCCPCLQPPPS